MSLITKSSKKLNVLNFEDGRKKKKDRNKNRLEIFFNFGKKKSENVSPPSSFIEKRDALVPVESEDDVTRLFVQFLLLVID